MKSFNKILSVLSIIIISSCEDVPDFELGKVNQLLRHLSMKENQLMIFI